MRWLYAKKTLCISTNMWLTSPETRSTPATLLAVGFALCFASVGSETLGDEYKEDFRQQKFDGRVMEPTRTEAIQFLKSGSDGLRITLPKFPPGLGEVGVISRFKLMGEFEATLYFDVENIPASGNQGGVMLLLEPASAYMQQDWKSLSRGVRTTEGSAYTVHSRKLVGQTYQDVLEHFPTTASSGKLRLIRKGSKLQFHVADGDSIAFRQLAEVEDKGQTYRMIAGVKTESSKDGVDVRLLELTVSGNQLTGIDSLRSSPNPNLKGKGPTGNSNWIWWVGGLVGAVGGAGVVWKLVASIHWKRASAETPNWLSQTSPYDKSAATNQPQTPHQTAPAPTVEPAKEPAPKKVPAPAAKVAPIVQAPSAKPPAARRDPPAARRDAPSAPYATSPPPSPPKSAEVKTEVKAPPAHTEKIIEFNEERLRSLEQKAHDFLKANPDTVSYGENFRFRFRYRDRMLNGPFVTWREIPHDACQALGSSRKEIEEKLPKLFEGEYRDGQRYGKFTYWDEHGAFAIVDYGDPAAEQHQGSPLSAPQKPSGAVAMQPADGTRLAAWDEKTLHLLEQKAADFLKANPDVVSYGEHYLFRFRYRGGKLNGPFIAWRTVPLETTQALGTNRKEVEDKLPKHFEGEYVDGKRQGKFTCWDDQGRSVVIEFRDGVARS